MSLDSLQDLLVENLRDLLSAEKQLTVALPKMVKGAATPALQEALNAHLFETQTHVSRLEEALELIGDATRAKHCKGMEGLIEEGSEVLEEDGDDAVKDAGLIAAAQKVEHYEIAAYGCAVTYAELINRADVVELLRATLAEEEAADEKLTALATSDINRRACAAGSEDSGAEEEPASQPRK